MCSLCRLPVAKNHIFLANFDILGGSCIDPLLPMRAKFGVLEQTQGLHLQAKFHLNVFIVSASGGQKPQFWTNFDIFGGSCTDPFLPMRAKFGELYQTRGIRLHLYVPNFVWIALLCRPLLAKNPNFCLFGLRHFVVSSAGGNLKKLNTSAQLQTFPYPTASKSFIAKSGAQTRTFKSVTNRRQADKQKKLNVFGRPGGW